MDFISTCPHTPLKSSASSRKAKPENPPMLLGTQIGDWLVGVTGYAVLALLPILVCWAIWKSLKLKFPPRQLAFLCGCVLLLLYTFCIVVPFYFQGYATMPLSAEAARNPTGLPAFL